jgi:calcium-dependent protein kinase
VIKLYETFEDANSIFLVMEICDGGELFDKITDIGYFPEQ